MVITNAEKRKLIKRLRGNASKFMCTNLMLEAAAALEATLWKPIEEMPDELKDGRDLLVWRPELKGIHNAHAANDRWNGNSWENSWRDAQPTHYMVITPPEVAE